MIDGRREPATARRSAARPVRALLAAYCLFVVYGSLFPFTFTTDPEEIRRDLAHAVFQPFGADGRRRFSIADVASNVLLGVPLGLLLVRAGFVGGSALAHGVGAAAIAAAFGIAVETGQLLAPGRTASALDVVAQVVGALLGGLGAGWAPPLLRTSAGRRLGQAARQRPALLIASLLALVLAADALYPYAVTLDMSTLRAGVKEALRAPFHGIAQRFWGDLLVEKVLAYASLAAACRGGLPPAVRWGASLSWTLVTGFAVSLEIGKLFIVGRAPTPGNLVLASAGALVGATVSGWVGPWSRGGLPDARVLASAALGLLAFAELTPFDVSLSPDALAAKARRIEWLPFASYYGADPHRALFDAAKKLVLGGFAGAALTGAGARAPVAWTCAVAALLETMQILQVSHLPSTSDVAVIAIGAATGRALLARYAAWSAAPSGPATSGSHVSVLRH